MHPPRIPFSKEFAVVLAALLLFWFISPAAAWWAKPAVGWFTPYALWLVIILGAALIHLRDDSDEP